MKKHLLIFLFLLAAVALSPAGPATAQDLGGLFKRTVERTKQEIRKKAEDKTAHTVARPLEQGLDGQPATAPQDGVPVAVGPVPVADDSPAAREAAIARLRAAAPAVVCADASTMSRTYGTTCNSREFPAPPILAAPRKAWETKPGWWGAWSPFLVGNLVLTGSCNNDGNEGISALDAGTGKTVWRIAGICREGGRRGSMGSVGFHELPSGEVLLVYPRNDGGPTDHYVIDVRAGRIVRTLTPARRGPMRHPGEVFTVVNQSTPEGVSYITALSPALDRELWQNRGFGLAMGNDLDPQYKPTFSAPAASGGVMFVTARSLGQPGFPTRQLHAIDLRTGQTLWRHTDQPMVERNTNNTVAYRSDDGTPMVAGGKVIIRVDGLLGTVGIGRDPDGEGLRALDPRTGATLWTTAPVRGRRVATRIAAGDVLVVEVRSGGDRELWGHRLADGKPAWRRPVPAETRLLASSGGAFYLSERVPAGDGKHDFRVHGLDGRTGTLLWTTRLPGHNLDIDGRWDIEDRSGGTAQGPSWRIGRDGAIYGVTLTGAFKLQ
ncbi:PQQ-binding-like beta-propeller repeat protein [Pseudoxanthomonas suwonensis]|uniref:Pyrrolo-quinoline quinone repeat domain-containing protein n=1 Tax=Pseudoxanthomonas suwonensis TaxID=314722 RepID=A0A0E3UNH9_9GAMM|nr:PQQ-binding-like beta-propeller repeat protein [Pseudoxanthomonas suwonensis]AKC86970.1 hypothetical protein WQ53_09620 [Pseudoxanthomonas suwonensis]